MKFQMFTNFFISMSIEVCFAEISSKILSNLWRYNALNLVYLNIKVLSFYYATTWFYENEYFLRNFSKINFNVRTDGELE